MRAHARVRALTPAELTWIAAVPSALVLIAAVILLGPPVGHALLDPGAEGLWPREAPFVIGRADPVKHGRYLVALLGPVLLAAAIWGSARRGVRLAPALTRSLVMGSQVLVLVLAVAAAIGQNAKPVYRVPAFDASTGLVALAVTLLLLLAPRHRRLAAWAARPAREDRARAAACLAIAVLLTTTWLLVAIDSERTIGGAPFADLPPWAMGDTFAILDGRTPLVNFHAVYGQLWAYVAAGGLSVFGASLLTFTLLMTAISGLALLAVYALLRRVARSAPAALALYLPFLATGFLAVGGPPDRPMSNAPIFSVWPMRYAGPYLLAWLTARHLDGARPRRAWPLFLLGGLVAINNLELGLGALAGTIVALICARPPRTRRAAARLAASAAVGLLGALALVSLLTLLRAGELPRPGLLLEFPRIFGVVGLVSLPLPLLGFHLALYVTFTAAIATAVVRLLSGAEDRLLTGMLAWSGVFGLLAGSYIVGRSDALKLLALFSAWGLSVALLAIAVARDLAARGWRRPDVAHVAVLLAFGFAIASLLHLPAPWRQIARLGETAPPPSYEQPAAERFVAAHARPGDRVAILIPLGHRIAYRLGITDVYPYPIIEAMVTRRQFRTLIDTVRREHAHELFLPLARIAPAHLAALRRAGFTPRSRTAQFLLWSDG
jgi:hypothetical protein